MKTILILGLGAQGSTVAKRMNEEEAVGRIICADSDEKAVREMAGMLSKAEAHKIDATSEDSIAEAAGGVDLIVNALPIAFGRKVIRAALKAQTNYQDFAACDDGEMDWVEGIKQMLSETSEEFGKIGRTALISTGSAPGLISVVTRKTVAALDSCETIYNLVWEGVEAKRFLPFWWSPAVAYADMADPAFAYIDGEIVQTEPFSRPVYMQFRGQDKTIRLVEHAHDEPVEMGINAGRYLKGAKNIYFKYGGVGVEFAEPLYRLGILSRQPVEIDGVEVIPRNLVIKLTPPAPKYYEEIKAIMEEGLKSDEGAMVVQAYGTQNGQKVKAETYINAPGCEEAFRRSGLTGETYLTGQCGALFTKLFVNDKLKQKGLFSPEMLDMDQIDYYLDEAAKLDITLESTLT